MPGTEWCPWHMCVNEVGSSWVTSLSSGHLYFLLTRFGWFYDTRCLGEGSGRQPADDSCLLGPGQSQAGWG